LAVHQKPLRVSDLTPDEVRIAVDWDAMGVGSSVFIPCINTTKAKAQVQTMAVKRCWTIKTRVAVEKMRSRNVFGLRIWRTT